MDLSPFTAMQKAVDIVNASPHPVNKIAAALIAGTDLFTCTNMWPDPILQKLGMETRIGNSSGTVHAEISCILSAAKEGKATQGGSLFITDPFCPNCAKNIAESGIRHIYIDHKGFNKDFAQRRGDEFDSMSMRIAQRAGIAVYEIWRKEEKIIPLHTPQPGYKPPEDYPVELVADDGAKEAAAAFRDFVRLKNSTKLHDRFACAYAVNAAGQGFFMFAEAHPALGYSFQEDASIVQQNEGKYSFVLEPSNRLMMTAAKHGLRIQDGMIFAAQVPTAREQVNIVAAGFTSILIGHADQARDENGLAARTLLQDNGILHFKNLA